MKPPKNTLGAWIHRQAPTRDSFERSRFLRPFAKRVFHPALWRFTRRSVPRGVALGLLVGIFLLIPGVQIAGVALLALPVRANIPIGAAMTFLSMPATTPFILAASVYVGNRCLQLGTGSGQFLALIESGAPLSAWMDLGCVRGSDCDSRGCSGSCDHIGRCRCAWLCACRMVLALVD